MKINVLNSNYLSYFHLSSGINVDFLDDKFRKLKTADFHTQK